MLLKQNFPTKRKIAQWRGVFVTLNTKMNWVFFSHKERIRQIVVQMKRTSLANPLLSSPKAKTKHHAPSVIF